MNTRRLVAQLAATPILGVVSGLVIVVLFAWLGWTSWLGTRAYADGPTPMDVETALTAGRSGEAYVALPAVTAEACAGLFSQGGTTFLPLHADDGTVDAVAYFSGATSCERIVGQPLAGTLNPMRPAMRTGLVDAGVAITADPLALCTYCGATNAWMGVGLSAVFCLLGLGLMPLGYLLAAQKARGDGPAWLQG
ncbi:MAG: hypothetical protein H6733_11595 [Alphaproteobacteria bacterium]|nr:hypothetical protein [Alphaproteobacteria bacterium]